MEYKTVGKEVSVSFIEKTSEFIGHIKPVQTEQEARAFLEQKRSEHSDATHNVYAYILRENNTQRFSDAGEPHGTAGMPTLAVLQKEQLTDVVCVVTRYFGGILLGAGGLVRAYSRSASEAIEEAGIADIAPFTEFSMEYGYDLHSQMERAVLLISVGDMKVGQVAAELGFEDTAYFCRIFKKTFGITPTKAKYNTALVKQK